MSSTNTISRDLSLTPVMMTSWHRSFSLHSRHYDHNGVSNQQPHGCLLNRLFGRRSTKTSKLRVTGLCAGNSPVSSPHKGPGTRKMFLFDDVIMFPRYWPFYAVNLPVSGEFPSQMASDTDFDVSLMWICLSCQTNSRMTGDFRLHGVHVTSLQWFRTDITHSNIPKIYSKGGIVCKPFLEISWLGTHPWGFDAQMISDS